VDKERSQPLLFGPLLAMAFRDISTTGTKGESHQYAGAHKAQLRILVDAFNFGRGQRKDSQSRLRTCHRTLARVSL
jgi:hypothetical protein